MVKYYSIKKMCARKDVTFLDNLFSNLSSYSHTHKFLKVYAIILYYYINPKSVMDSIVLIISI